MMLVLLKQVRSVDGARDKLKMEVNTDTQRLIHILIAKHIPYRLENIRQA